MRNKTQEYWRNVAKESAERSLNSFEEVLNAYTDDNVINIFEDQIVETALTCKNDIDVWFKRFEDHPAILSKIKKRL